MSLSMSEYSAIGLKKIGEGYPLKDAHVYKDDVHGEYYLHITFDVTVKRCSTIWNKVLQDYSKKYDDALETYDYHFWSPNGVTFCEMDWLNSGTHWYTTKNGEEEEGRHFKLYRQKSGEWDIFEMYVYDGYALSRDDQGHKKLKYTQLKSDDEKAMVKLFRDNFAKLVKLPPGQPPGTITCFQDQ